MARYYLLSNQVARRLSTKDSRKNPDNDHRSDQRRSDQNPSPAKNYRSPLRFAFSTQSRSQTSFKIGGRVKSESPVAHNRTQTTNPFVALRAGMAVLQVCLDFHALDEVKLAVDVAVNQLTRFVATQCVPPFPCVWRAALAVVCARAPIAT